MQTEVENKRLELIRSGIGQDKFVGKSPAGNWLGGRLLQADKGCLVMEYTVRHEMTNPAGTLHGGMICAILDELIGITTYTLDITHFHPTINLNVDYLSSAREGEKVVGKTSLVRQGRNVIHIQGELFNAEGKLLAKASSNLIKGSMPV